MITLVQLQHGELTIRIKNTAVLKIRNDQDFQHWYFWHVTTQHVNVINKAALAILG